MSDFQVKKRTRRFALLGQLLGGAALWFAALPAAAQEGGMVPIPIDAASPFNLRARGDYAVTGYRPSGVASWALSNVSGMDAPRQQFMREPRIFNTPSGTVFGSFEWPFIISAPVSDLAEGVNPDDLNGGGYTFTTNQVLAQRREELLASDRSGRELLALGITARDDGSCRDYVIFFNGGVPAGAPLLPHTSCTDTWPNQDAWEGKSRITLDGFVAAQGTVAPAGDPFAFWRVPDDLTTGRPLGDQATFGEFVDWSADLLLRYPEAVPGGGGVTPLLRGWPLGLTVRFDAFYFNLPGINNAFFVQYLIINESENVWGRPIDYDSLYVGTMRLPGNRSQFQAFQVDLSRGVWFTHQCRRSGTGKTQPYGGSPGGCPAGSAYLGGAQGLFVLKSPIGDLRNKLLSDPASPFFDPTHPNADDTITFNHSHGCGFITCSGQSLDFSERSAFGMMSSTEPNVLDGRAVTDMVDVSYWNVFHPSEVWPSRTDAQGRAFNRYAPAGWDYDDDGVEDTLYIDNCGSQGCVPPQSDTLPGGWLNRVGQTAPLSIGPFKLAAGDTVGLMLAYVADRDSVSFQATLQNIFDLYMTFFFVPEPAPPPTLAASATAVTGGAQTETSVRLNWNDRLVTFVDPFLTKLYNDIRAADPTTDLGRILALNPWVDDSLLARSANNVAAIHVFRSCDGGATFTDDSDCNPDQIPAADQSSKFANIGWLPWRSLDAGVTSVSDGDVFAGVPFLYSMVTETRGAKWRILFDQGPGAVPTDASGNPVCQPARCIPREFEFAPAILSPLTRTPGAPGVTSVYVPITRTAGRVAATATVESALGPALVPVTFLLTRTARDGSFRALFADTLNVTTVVTSKDLGGGKRDTTAVAVTVVTSGATPQSFTGTAVLPMRGATLVRQRSVIDPTDATVTTDTVVNRIVSGGTAMVPMLVLETTGGAATPLLATGSLAVGRTTPGAFLDTPTFPGFVMDVNASVGGTFSRQVYLGPQGDTIPSDIVAGQAIEWQTGTGNARALLTGKLAPLAFSQYRLAWQDRPYGPGEEFRVSAGLQDRFTESVNARATAATSLAQDTALVRRINQALGTDSVAGLTLEALALPFEVTNVTESRDVQIAIVQHRTTVLLGQGADTQRVSVPAGKWTPGDRLVFLEVVNDTLRPTWHAVIGCTSTLRITCDATATAGYAAVVENGVTQDVIYFRPLVAGADFTATVAAERVDAVARKDDLKTIKVVPNPYVVFSEFERSASARVIKFTHVPDEGRLRIYTISGQFVQEIRWSEGDLNGTGDLEWNLRTRENTELAYGLYIWVLDSPAGTARGKFVVIR